MRVGQEDLSRHRRRGKDAPPRRGWVLVLFIVVVGGGFLAYAQRDLLLDYARKFLTEYVIVADQLERVVTEPEPESSAEPEPEPPPAPQPEVRAAPVAQPPAPAGLDESEVRQMLNAQAQEQQKKIAALTKEVRYVGAIMRRLSGSVAALQESTKQETAQLRSIAERLEKIDTSFQALSEKASADNTALNQAVTKLRQDVASLQSSSQARAGRLDEIDGTISNFNTRLIDLER